MMWPHCTWLDCRDVTGWQYIEEVMPDRRTMVDSVLLPTGQVFLTNGQRVS